MVFTLGVCGKPYTVINKYMPSASAPAPPAYDTCTPDQWDTWYNEELKAEVEAKVTADPATFGYFFTQHDDYITLKAAVAHNVLHGVKSTPAAVASIAVGLETLKLADYLVPLALQQCPPS